jgi:SPP1 family predicted phage head-tail adaptor
MRVGELRHRISVTRQNEVEDGEGGFTKTPVTVCYRTPAHVEPLSGRQLERAQQVDPRTTHRVTVRYQRDIEVRHALTYHDPWKGDRMFEILWVEDVDERHRELRLLCVEAA